MLASRAALPGITVGLLLLAGAFPSLAEPPGGADRQNQLGLYVWIPVIDGSATLGDTTLPVESSLSDFNLGGPLGYARNPRPWGALVTTVFMDIESDFQTSMPSLSGKDSFEFFLMDAVTNRRWSFSDDKVGVELLLGFRYWNVEQRRELELGPANEESSSWADGILGGRVTVQMAKRWWFLGRLDGAIGQSDESWNGEVSFQWRTSRLMSFVFGYRLITLKYETGSEESRLELDTDIGGPTMAFLFRF